MSRAISTTLEALEAVGRKTDSIAVAFSGGKDSLATLDLCTRSFKRVEAFFMSLVPGLACETEPLRIAASRWGVKVTFVPHWVTYKAMRAGEMMWPSHALDDIPDMKLRDIYDIVKADLRCDYVATGAKRCDSAWRRWYLSNTSHYTDLLYPLLEWNKADVLAYLAMRRIPMPSQVEMGVDLSTPSPLWLHERHPDDFRRLCEYFPFAEAVIWQAKWYGPQGATAGKKADWRHRGSAAPREA